MLYFIIIQSKNAEIGRGWQIRRRVSGQAKLLNCLKILNFAKSSFCTHFVQ